MNFNNHRSSFRMAFASLGLTLASCSGSNQYGFSHSQSEMDLGATEVPIQPIVKVVDPTAAHPENPGPVEPPENGGGDPVVHPPGPEICDAADPKNVWHGRVYGAAGAVIGRLFKAPASEDQKNLLASQKGNRIRDLIEYPQQYMQKYPMVGSFLMTTFNFGTRDAEKNSVPGLTIRPGLLAVNSSDVLQMPDGKGDLVPLRGTFTLDMKTSFVFAEVGTYAVVAIMDDAGMIFLDQPGHMGEALISDSGMHFEKLACGTFVKSGYRYAVIRKNSASTAWEFPVNIQLTQLMQNKLTGTLLFKKISADPEFVLPAAAAEQKALLDPTGLCGSTGENKFFDKDSGAPQAGYNALISAGYQPFGIKNFRRHAVFNHCVEGEDHVPMELFDKTAQFYWGQSN